MLPIMKKAILLVTLVSVISCFEASEEKAVTVFAAASTVDFLNQLAEDYEKTYFQAVDLSFAASSTLARQIEAGAKVDFFISANHEWDSYLRRTVPELPDSEPYLGNEMVLITGPGQKLPARIQDWQLEGGRLAIGDPQHVPAGKYAKTSLEFVNLWSTVKPQLVTTANVRQALRLVLAGECRWGIVYRSDAVAANLPHLVLELPEGSAVTYRFMALKSEMAKAPNQFKDYLYSSKARDLATKMGFRWPRDLKTIP